MRSLVDDNARLEKTLPCLRFSLAPTGVVKLKMVIGLKNCDVSVLIKTSECSAIYVKESTLAIIFVFKVTKA